MSYVWVVLGSYRHTMLMSPFDRELLFLVLTQKFYIDKEKQFFALQWHKRSLAVNFLKQAKSTIRKNGMSLLIESLYFL